LEDGHLGGKSTFQTKQKLRSPIQQMFL